MCVYRAHSPIVCDCCWYAIVIKLPAQCTMIPQITLEISLFYVCACGCGLARAPILIVFFICAINTLLSCQIVKLMTESAMILFVICFELPYPSSPMNSTCSLSLGLPFSFCDPHFIAPSREIRALPAFLCVCLAVCTSEWKNAKQSNWTHTHTYYITSLYLCKRIHFIVLHLCLCVRECVEVSHAHSIYCRKLSHSSIQTMQRTNCHCDINLSSFGSHGISNPAHWKNRRQANRDRTCWSQWQQFILKRWQH